MQVLKIVFVAAFALCALQAQGAEIPEFRNATHLNLRVFVVNGAAIAKNLFTAVNSGLDKSKTNANLILNELAPEAKTLARKTIDKARAVIYDEEKRVDHVFKTLDKALDTLKPVKPCYDKYSGDAKKVAHKTEKSIVALINFFAGNYRSEIKEIQAGINNTINNLRKVFDTEVDAVIKCLKPGRKDVKDCLIKEIDNCVQGVFEGAVDIYLIITNSKGNFSWFWPDLLKALDKLISTFIADSTPVLNNFADCVSKMK